MKNNIFGISKHLTACYLFRQTEQYEDCLLLMSVGQKEHTMTLDPHQQLLRDSWHSLGMLGYGK